MDIFEDIIVTGVQKPIVVRLQKGQQKQMINRSFFGISLCVNGQITYTMNGKSFVSDKYKVVLLPKGGTYSFTCNCDGVFPVINFECQNLNCDEIITFPTDNPMIHIKDFNNIKDLFLKNETNIKIFRNFYDMLINISLSTAQNNSSKLDIAFNFIESNISDPELSNNMIAQQVGISEVYLRKLFYEKTKTSPRQYILDSRIKKAQQMLIDTSLSVSEISEKCGFSSQYHFCRTFKSRTGMTPTKFATKNQIYNI